MPFGENEVIAVKIALREGVMGDYAVYIAPGDVTDEEALEQGQKVDEETGRRIAGMVNLFGLTEKHWTALKYRR